MISRNASGERTEDVEGASVTEATARPDGGVLGRASRPSDAVRRRRAALILLVALGAFAIAFGIGLATKTKTQTQTQVQSLVPSNHPAGRQLAVGTVVAGPAIPGLRPASKPKHRRSASSAVTTVGQSSTAPASATSGASVSGSPTVTSGPVGGLPSGGSSGSTGTSPGSTGSSSGSTGSSSGSTGSSSGSTGSSSGSTGSSSGTSH
jgi:hypothetical protein